MEISADANMAAFKVALFGLLFISVLASESKCPPDAISKLVVCYYRSETSLTSFNICNCSHIIFTHGVRTENNSITANEDSVKYLKIIKERKANLSAIFTLEVKQNITTTVLKSENRSEQLINEISGFLQESLFDGVELNFKFDPGDGVTKETYAFFVKKLSKKLSSNHRRVKRESYDVFEKLQDDITTAAYTTQTPKNSTSKTQTIMRKNRKRKQNSRKIKRDNEEDKKDADHLSLEEIKVFSGKKTEESDILKNTKEEFFEEKKFLIFVRLSIKPETVAKKFDLKALSRYADYLIVPTHNIVSDNEKHITYHPSRLMGLSDILNTDSILDLLTGMGATKSKIVISLPATVLKFQLKDENKNTPRSPSLSGPQIIDQSQLCSFLSKGNWTVERDEDLTAPYAFSEKSWLAFEDEISVNIKGKYILLRELAGGAIYPIDADLNDGSCTNHTKPGGYLTGILHKNFESLERKPRALVLESLQEEIHDTAYTNLKGGVTISEYRIVRVVDHSGAVHVIRKNTKTQFECSRQGYFSHPLGCNKFYRCVKFDQYSDEFTVFEYDCPAGLAFDERWEVCVWPGSLPHGAPCTGSSEIAPVPRSHYQCPSREGFFADPENCRWFFACLDHARDGLTPLTAYEFRCPFGLIFSEQKLACDWPWLVGSCGNQGSGIHLATFINGGNLEISFGQFTNSDASFIDFGKKFGSTLKSGEAYNAQGSYEGAQSAGFGYIASQFDDSHDRESFAAFPDYEISGGRIFNKGGVVLNQNVAGISGSATAYIQKGLAEVSNNEGITGASRSFGEKIEQSHQGIVPFVDDTHSASKINFQNSKPTLETNALKISEISLQGQHLHQQHGQNSISTPKSSSVSIQLGQIKEEEISQHSQHPSFEPTKQFNGKEYFISHGFSVNQPAVSVELPAVTSTPQTFTSSGLLSSLHLKTESLSTPGVSYSSTPNPEFYNFEQLNAKQDKLSNVFFANQPAVSIRVPQLLENSLGTPTVSTLTSGSEFTSNSENQPTSFTVTDRLKETDQIFLSKEKFNQGSLKIIDQSNERKFFVGVPEKIPAIQVNTFEIKNGQQNSVSENTELAEVPKVTTPSIYVSTLKTKTEPVRNLLGVSLRPAQITFGHSSIDRKISNELRLSKPQSSYAIPQIINGVSTTTSYGYSKQSNAKMPVVTPEPDFKIFSQDLTDKTRADISLVTPQSSAFNSGTLKAFTKEYYDVSTAIPETSIHSIKGSSFHNQKETSQRKIYDISSLTPEIKIGGVVQETFQRFVTPKPDVKFFQAINSDQFSFTQQHPYSSSIQESENYFSSQQPLEKVGVTPESSVIKKTDIFAPKVKQANILTEFSVEQQPIVSVESFKSSNRDHAVPTLVPQFSSENVFSKNLAVNNFNVQSVSTLSEHMTITTPSPVVSITPSRVTYAPNLQLPNSAVRYISKSLQPVNLNVKAFSPPHQQTVVNVAENAIFGQKSNAQEKVYFPPVAPVTTLAPLSYKQETIQRISSESSSPDKNTGYLSLVTPKAEFFGSAIQQNSEVPLVQFETSDRNRFFSQEEQIKPVITQEVDLIKTKPLTEGRRTQPTEQQVSVPVTTPLPEHQKKVRLEQHFNPVVTTNKPFTNSEKFFELEISKSVELNPQIFQASNENLSSNPSFKPFEIQQQPLHLLSQKTFSTEQVIQPFFKQSDTGSVNSHNSNPPKNKYDNQYVFREQARVEEPKNILKQKQYLRPSVTSQPPLSTVNFSTTKTINFEQPNVYSVQSNSITPALFETSQIYQAGPAYTTTSRTQTDSYTKNSGKTVFLESHKRPQLQNVFFSKANFLIPASTELPQHAVFQSEELSVQTHKNFDSQKIFSSTPAINVLIQPESHSTSEPAVNIFETSARVLQYNKEQNFTPGRSRSSSDSRTKYAFNSNIKIPEPSREYILAQSRFTTPVPQLPTTDTADNQFQSIRSGFKGSTYLPPSSQNKSSKTSSVSPGNLAEEQISDDKAKQLYNKYSGQFNQVLNGKNEEFFTKISSENGKDKSKIHNKGSHTVQYDVSGTTSRQKSRGRQYHGGITSGLKATNKYEEYEINENKESQRSFDFIEGNKKSDISKTTIDLKNLEVDKNKKTVIVVSQVSDANPVLIGKLAGQCSCQSNVIELRGKTKKTKSSLRGKSDNQEHTPISNVYVPPYESNQANVEILGQTHGEASTEAPKTAIIYSSESSNDRISNSAEQNLLTSSTTSLPQLASSTLLSSLGPDGVVSITPKAVYAEDKTRKKQFRGRARYFSPSVAPGSSTPLLSAVPASEIANTYDYSILKEDESRIQNDINQGKAGGTSKLLAGTAFDRYGPGGWRGFDETLQGSVDCKRPGLFRHPKYCNKFYACNYDPWKERYTLHVFNCPIHLTYDSSISACNWPVRGPACADDNLLV